MAVWGSEQFKETMASRPAVQTVVATGVRKEIEKAEVMSMANSRKRVVAQSRLKTPNWKRGHIRTCIEPHLDLKTREVD